MLLERMYYRCLLTYDFSYIYDKSFTENSSLDAVKTLAENIGSSGFRLMRTIGIVVFLLAIMCAAISLYIKRSGIMRYMVWAKVARILMGVCCLFGIVGFLAVAMSVGEELGKQPVVKAASVSDGMRDRSDLSRNSGYSSAYDYMYSVLKRQKAEGREYTSLDKFCRDIQMQGYEWNKDYNKLRDAYYLAMKNVGIYESSPVEIYVKDWFKNGRIPELAKINQEVSMRRYGYGREEITKAYKKEFVNVKVTSGCIPTYKEVENSYKEINGENADVSSLIELYNYTKYEIGRF